MIYFKHVEFNQLTMYVGLFWVVWEIMKQDYLFSNTAIEISYDFHNDPVIIPNADGSILTNQEFADIFSEVCEFKAINHYTQFLSEIEHP